MPFIDVYFLPPRYLEDQNFLERLEKELVTELAKAMTNAGKLTRPEVCHVFFYENALRKTMPNQIIRAEVSSEAFYGNTPEVGALKLAATKVVGRIIHLTLNGQYTVEVHPTALEGDFKTYLKGREEY